MNYLAFDTSAEHLAVVARVGGKTKTEYTPFCGVKHSESLMPAVERVLNSLNATVSDIDVFSAVVGPGSFTGIRIGVATAKGLADGTGGAVLGVTAFDTAAYNIRSGKVLAVIDANHDHYYVCSYKDGALCEQNFVDGQTLNELSKEYKLLSIKRIDGFDVTIVDPVEGLRLAVEDKLSKASKNTDDLEPLYLRLSQAEEGRK